MDTKKPFVFRTDSKQITANMQRDFNELTTKQEMVSVGEMSTERGKTYMPRLYSFLEKCKQRFADDFIIEVERWQEVADRKVIRYRYRQALALPTPRPGRAYYYYDASTQTLDLLWDLPPKKACEWAYNNRTLVGLQHSDALKTILDYYDGTLTRKADEINNNIADHRRSYRDRRKQ